MTVDEYADIFTEIGDRPRGAQSQTKEWIAPDGDQA